MGSKFYFVKLNGMEVSLHVRTLTNGTLRYIGAVGMGCSRDYECDTDEQAIQMWAAERGFTIG